MLGSAASLFNNVMLSGLFDSTNEGVEVGGGGGPASDGSTETEELLCDGHEAGGSARGSLCILWQVEEGEVG